MNRWKTSTTNYSYPFKLVTHKFALLLSLLCITASYLFWIYFLISSRNSLETVMQEEKQLCKIPTLDPFHPTIMRTIVNVQFDVNWEIKCGHKKWFSVNPTVHTTKGVIWELVQQQKMNNHSCCYQVMEPQKSPDPLSNYSQFSYNHVDPTLYVTYSDKCVQVNQNVTLIPQNVEFISIECRGNSNGSKVGDIVYRDMFALVPSKTTVKTPIQRTRTNYVPSILIIGLDSVSQQLIRQLPRTYKYLTGEMKGKGLNGYNKVGESTLPNVVPLLTGLHLDELSRLCWNHSFLSFFDSCPFIWKEYSMKGYLTSYGEDNLPYSIFYNKLYARRGFNHPPTNYFYNLLAMQLQNKSINQNYCTNDRLQFDNILNYVQATAQVLKDKPYFQFVWASSLFTKEFKLVKNADLPLVNTLKFLHEGHFLNDTILILVSDHGYRFSPIVELRQGRFESRMPLFYTVFPEKFRQNWPRAVDNFEKNKFRLTTPFDVYETLNDLLDLDGNLSEMKIRDRELDNNILRRRGISLFLPIPANRTCVGAGIEENFCTCRDSMKVNLSETEGKKIVRTFALKGLQQINMYIANWTNCMPLKLNEDFVITAEIISPNNGKYLTLVENENGILSNEGNFEEILVTFQAVPGFGSFETRIGKLGNEWIVKDVLRINEYKNQSHCVFLYKLKSYCYCRVQLK